MLFYRAVWVRLFTVGIVALAEFVHAFDAWAMLTAYPGAEQFCRGTLGGNVPVTRAPLCLAVWFTETKVWVGYAQEMLLQAGHGLHGAELLRTADVGLFAVGSLAGGIALTWLWATAMAHVAVAVVAGSFSLVQGLSQFLGGRAA
jgi:hypothetical protein